MSDNSNSLLTGAIAGAVSGAVLSKSGATGPKGKKGDPTILGTQLISGAAASNPADGAPAIGKRIDAPAVALVKPPGATGCFIWHSADNTAAPGTDTVLGIGVKEDPYQAGAAFAALTAVTPRFVELTAGAVAGGETQQTIRVIYFK